MARPGTIIFPTDFFHLGAGNGKRRVGELPCGAGPGFRLRPLFLGGPCQAWSVTLWAIRAKIVLTPTHLVMGLRFP
jgi:hypothetical protein